MNITENLVIATLPCKYKDQIGKPYALYIVGHGEVGDKFNQGVGHNSKRFPTKAADRFATRQEAMEEYHNFLDYVEDMIRKRKRSSSNHTPSYYTWT
jgi:hypothetical protein